MREEDVFILPPIAKLNVCNIVREKHLFYTSTSREIKRFYFNTQIENSFMSLKMEISRSLNKSINLSLEDLAGMKKFLFAFCVNV